MHCKESVKCPAPVFIAENWRREGSHLIHYDLLSTLKNDVLKSGNYQYITCMLF